jgi:formylglycine-generating enzyme required for sulfatase activity
MLRAGGAAVRLGREGDPDEPAREVTLRSFCIDKSATTASAYKTCSDRGDCPPASRTNEWDGIGADDHAALDPMCTARDPKGQAARPVNCVTWDMANAYCARARPGGRLPTEAEWEVASRSTSANIAEWVSDWRGPLTGAAAVDPAGPTGGDERVVRGAHAPGAEPTRFGAAPPTRSHAIGFRCASSL